MFKLRGLDAVDHRFQVPLDHGAPDGETIEVFAREFVAPGPGADSRPWLVFLQGGPGFESPRPLGKDGWIGAAADRYRVLALDQRGTGLSTPHTARSIVSLGDTVAQAEHLRHYRADAIVSDAEWIRRELLGPDERWTVLGQSFGGFCVTHYLSRAPEGLSGAMITGGLPGLNVHADDVYERTFRLTAQKNEAMHRRFPGLRTQMRRVFERLLRGGVMLPGGDPLSPRRLQTIGAQLGFSYGATQIHYLFERAFIPGSDELSMTFLRGIENLQAYDTNPFYAILHELCYAQGRATDWSAERVRAHFPEFDVETALRGDGAPLLTGEMIFPWMMEEWTSLAPIASVANALSARDGWPTLYDEERLSRNAVPVSAVIFHDDMFVPADLSLKTADVIRGLDPWVTNEFEHDGLRADGPRVLGELIERMALSGAELSATSTAR
ncbi:MAG: alpha/beta fold hydrolase [Planctomycetota bacterium]